MYPGLCRDNRGFSFIELMVILATLAILTVLALPEYGRQLVAETRDASKEHLRDVVARQNRYLADNRQYAVSLSMLGFSSDTVGITEQGKYTTADSFDATYQLTIASASNYSFTVQATPVNEQLDDTDCGTLAISSNGSYSASGNAPGVCW